jgi:uncharacterized protein YbjT (DUF2867 family)
MKAHHSEGGSRPRAGGEPAILVTGGAGFVGQHVVRQLAELGKTVVALYHHKLPESLDNVYPVGSDMGSAELLAAPLRGIDTVIHLAWEGGLTGPSEPVTFNCLSAGTGHGLPRNAQVLRNLLTAMERAGTRRIVFVSAAGAGRSATIPFLQEKYLAEFLVLNSKIPEKVILRSTVVFGGQGSDRFVRSIMRVMKYPVYPVPKLASAVAPVHVKDLASAVVAAAQNPFRESGEPAALLDVQGGENYAVQDLFKIVSERCVKGTRIALPSFLGTPLLPLFERDGATPQPVAKIGHFLALGAPKRKVEAETDAAEQPLQGVLPKKLATFRDGVLD